MTRIMKSCVVALVVLFLWRVEEGAEACTCLDISPEEAICKSNVVIRAYVTRSEEVEGGTKYYLYPYKVFRGRKMYTVYSTGPCRTSLDIKTDYLLTGMLGADGTMHIIMCNFKKPWYLLDYDERRLLHNLKKRCPKIKK